MKIPTRYNFIFGSICVILFLQLILLSTSFIFLVNSINNINNFMINGNSLFNSIQLIIDDNKDKIYKTIDNMEYFSDRLNYSLSKNMIRLDDLFDKSFNLLNKTDIIVDSLDSKVNYEVNTFSDSMNKFNNIMTNLSGNKL